MMNHYRGNSDNFCGSSSFIRYPESIQNPMRNVTNYNSSQVQNNDQCQPTYHVPAPVENNSYPNRSRCAGYNTMAQKGRRFKVYNSSKSIKCNEIELEMKLNEIKIGDNKSPVTKLNEIMALMKKTIQYETISVTGSMHSPIFTVRAKSDDLIADGSGSTKKTAKHNAANEFLKLMNQNNGNNIITSSTSTDVDLAEKCSELQSELNPIGKLQELCMTNRWQYPCYEYSYPAFDEFKNLKFTVVCSLKIFRSIGEGKTKQAAKKQAARLLFEKIKNLSPEEKAVLNYNEFQTPSEVLLNGDQLNNVDGKISPSEALKCVNKFKNQLKLSNNPSINKLKSIDNLNMLKNAVGILNKIGEEEHFTTTYVNLEKSEKPTILVQVAIYPLLVHLGTGNTFDEAQKLAALGVLVYLKLMLEK